jgi:hypothetical protein
MGDASQGKEWPAEKDHARNAIWHALLSAGITANLDACTRTLFFIGESASREKQRGKVIQLKAILG